ncbi:ABC-2 family transporter permease [Streptomonospora wellingtoniae]|uniref:Lantibiotic immunity ABC transporter MutE/EpiE family permease subunit n=1 Tax=Streptomonospora wellingtoniae TaxID=3075544 RepID=A0ABU2KQ04_9ACTN|nr:hypothetical protein [Streptomonospora sp. DSM 45055]MDT0301351.1 hypothetical protein [Streptomonospora sp. DSM 45055]
MAVVPPPAPEVRARRRDDPSLITVAGVELARLRRGFPLWFTLGLPIALVLPLGLISVGSPEGQAGQLWGVWSGVVAMFWGVSLPMVGALYTSAAARQDEGARAVLYGYAVPRYRFLLGRFAALALLGSCQAGLLVALLAPMGAVLEEPQAAGAAAASVLLPWAASLGPLVLCLLVAEEWGFAPTVCLGVLGSLFGALLADKSVWWAVPLGWPMTAVVPLADVRASGVPLPEGHPLTDAGIVPLVVALSAGLAAVLLAAGAYRVGRKEL